MPSPRYCRLTFTAAMVLAMLALASTVSAATAEERCRAAKTRIAGRYAACRMHADAARQGSGDGAAHSKALAACDRKLASTWRRVDRLAAGTPCAAAAADTVATALDAATDAVANAVGGPRFRENGDGTVTDRRTGLQWEKKDAADGIPDPANPHDADNLYFWTGIELLAPYPPTGTAFSDFLAKLNACAGQATYEPPQIGGGFAGHCDWRLPSVVEIQSILLTRHPCDVHPCIDPIFGPMPAYGGQFLTNTALPTDPFGLWTVHFGDGSPADATKYGFFGSVRAVRGGR